MYCNRTVGASILLLMVLVMCTAVAVSDDVQADDDTGIVVEISQGETKTFSWEELFGQSYWEEYSAPDSASSLDTTMVSLRVTEVAEDGITVTCDPDFQTGDYGVYLTVMDEAEVDIIVYRISTIRVVEAVIPEVTIDSVGGTEATVGYEYTYNVQTTPSDATIQISGVQWLSVSGHAISGTPISSGSFTLTITASAEGYATATQTVIIIVEDEPTVVGSPVINDVRFTVDNSNPYRLTFVVDATDASSVTVDYGDGTHGTGTTSTHTYSSSGTYTVRVTATNSAGSTSYSLSVLIADRSPGTSVQYNHQYTYTLGIDTEGITPTVTGCPFLNVTTGSNYVTVSGTPSSTAYVGQTYAVVLTVGDFSMTWNLTVTEGSTVPVAGFTFETDGLTVIITSTASNADLTYYQWTSGGSFVQSNTGTTRYTYSEPGTYTVTQRVTATIDGQTITDEFSATVTVTVNGGEGDGDGNGSDGDGWTGIFGIVLVIVGILFLAVGAYTGNYAAAGISALIAVVGAILWWMF